MSTNYSSKCTECQGHVDWIDCPTGGWWAHRQHPADNHDARVDWQPMERMDDNGWWATV